MDTDIPGDETTYEKMWNHQGLDYNTHKFGDRKKVGVAGTQDVDVCV